MKKLIVIVLITIFSQTSFSQKTNCENFKIGKFVYKSEGLSDIQVTRKEKYQIEIVQDSNQAFEETIIWISDCSYILTYTKAPFEELIGKSVIVELFDIHNNLAHGKVSFGETTLAFTIQKIE